ncbi:hypothetical protein ACLB2K_056682 [Fragaria x ananassa]
MASSVHFQSHQLNGSVQVQMDEESIDHAIFVPGNSISKIEEEPKLRKQHSEDMSNIDMPILYIAKKILYTVFLIPAVLLVAIISPDESQYFIFSSFISMLLDPLFLYIPLINEERKCLMLDKKLMTAALILRIVTDLRYVMKIGSKTIKCRRCPKKIAGSIATDVVAILPIPQLYGLHMNKLKEICKHLDPVVYSKGKYIIREGEPLDMMFFITQGIALTYATDRSITTERLEKGECFGGDRLMTWAATASTSFSDLPNSRKTVKAHKNVELFALRAADLQRILSRPSSHFSNEGTHSDGYVETKVIQTVLSRLRDYVIKPRWLTTHG